VNIIDSTLEHLHCTDHMRPNMPIVFQFSNQGGRLPHKAK